MKKIYQLVILLISLQSYSQHIVLENGKFFVNGSQISTRETKQLLLTDYKATRQFQKAKSKEGIGGLLLGAGVALTVSDLAIGLFSDVKYPTALTYAGVASMAISIPVLSGRRKLITQAIDTYNMSSKQLGSNFNVLKYQLVANQNGIGIQLKF
ncbi:hypothetical protein [Flavobacterium sp.]